MRFFAVFANKDVAVCSIASICKETDLDVDFVPVDVEEEEENVDVDDGKIEDEKVEEDDDFFLRKDFLP